MTCTTFNGDLKCFRQFPCLHMFQYMTSFLGVAIQAHKPGINDPNTKRKKEKEGDFRTENTFLRMNILILYS